MEDAVSAWFGVVRGARVELLLVVGFRCAAWWLRFGFAKNSKRASLGAGRGGSFWPLW